MGSTISKASSWVTGQSESSKNQSTRNSTAANVGSPAGIFKTKLATPFVYQRRGSLYSDEDGHTAHEFYEEVTVGDSKSTMKQRLDNLMPQGEVPYTIPRLHIDFPVAMYEDKTAVPPKSKS